jgi:hypothetical protein
MPEQSRLDCARLSALFAEHALIRSQITHAAPCQTEWLRGRLSEVEARVDSLLSSSPAQLDRGSQGNPRTNLRHHDFA